MTPAWIPALGAALALATVPPARATEPPAAADIVIYGGTSAAVVAAVLADGQVLAVTPAMP